MRDDTTYVDWKKEVEIWCAFTDLNAQKQGGALFLSLKGKARETVLASIDDVKDFEKDGIVEKILQSLDTLYLKDTTETAFEAFDDFIKFRRPKSMSIQKYLLDFNLKNKKLVANDMTLPEGVLAYALLTCANSTKEQTQLCRATCSELTFAEMKKQIEKIAENASMTSEAEKVVPQETFVSQNECAYYEQEYQYSPVPYIQPDEPADNDVPENPELLEADDTFSTYYGTQRPYSRGSSRGYSQPRGRGLFPNHNAQVQRFGVMNPPDEMGYPMTCRFCKSTYHLLRDCPHAPSHMKTDAYRPYRGRGGFRGGSTRGRGGGSSGAYSGF